MAETAGNADAVRAGLKAARGADLVLNEKIPGSYLFQGQVWEDASRGVSLKLRQAIPLRFRAPDGVVQKSVMDGVVQFDARTEVNVCVSAWKTEVVRSGPWDRQSDPGMLEGHVWNVCIEQINHDNIARPRMAGLSSREYQEIAFLIEPPLRDMLGRFAALEHIAKVGEGPLRAHMLDSLTSIVNNVAANLERGLIGRLHPFVALARRAAYEAGRGVDELSRRLELLSAWQQPAAALVAFHAAGADTVRSFDPQQIAKLPFDRYFERSDARVYGQLVCVHGEPDVRIILAPVDRDNPYSSRATVELGSRRIEFHIEDVGFGSLSAHGNATATPQAEWLHIHMICNPCSAFLARRRLAEGVTPNMVERALRHLYVVLVSPQFGRWSTSRLRQVFSM